MPNGNGMGPNGMGPRTGRGAGFCNGNVPSPGYGRGGRGFNGGFAGGAGRGFGSTGRGFGRGIGRGVGFGRGVDSFDSAYAMPRKLSEGEYKEVLTEEVDYLEKRLKALKEELNPADKDSE